MPGPRPASDPPLLAIPLPRQAEPSRVVRPARPARRPGVRRFPATGTLERVVVPTVLDPALVAPEEPRIALPRERRPWVGRVALDVLALAGIAMSGLTAYAATHDLRPLVVRSGSMEPVLRTGGMVLVHDVPASTLRVGEVVAVRRPDGVTVTHRIVRLSRDGAVTQLVLKGDANKAQDAEPVPVTTAGRVVWNAPLVGRAAAWTATAQGGFVLGGLITGGFAMSLRRRRD